MSRKVLLRIAAGLVLFTAVGHTFGIFAPPPDDAQVLATLQSMEQTLMPMPVGAPRSFLTVMNGLSLTTSVYLVVTGLQLVWLSKQSMTAGDRAAVGTIGGGLLLAALIAFVCFFPPPAVCLAIGGALVLGSLRTGAAPR